jgi:type IV pilus assembly protein PilQ
MKLLNRIIIIVVLYMTITSIYANISEILLKKISTNFQNTSLSDVLRILASQNNLNLVIGDGVSGQVTIQLSSVTLADALNTILKSKGCHYVIQNDIILVKKFEDVVNGELSNSVIKLKYLDGYDLKTTLNPLLSEKGKIEALSSQKEEDVLKQRSDILVVTDVWENIRTIEATLENLDREPKQLEIEVQLIETLIGSNRQVGFNWPKSVSASVTGGEVTAPITKSTGGMQQEVKKLAGWYELPEIHDNITLGVLTVDELNASLSLLAQDNNSKLISNPKLTTLDNKKAIIDVGTSVPVPEVSRGISGDLISYREKQVSMYLEVIPRINEDNIITLSVHPILEEIIGYTGPSDYPQPITSRREVTTQVTVREGESIALGGLIKESNNKVVEKFWLLGDIPLLGLLFRHTKTIKEKTDLLIFITPKIIASK